VRFRLGAFGGGGGDEVESSRDPCPIFLLLLTASMDTFPSPLVGARPFFPPPPLASHPNTHAPLSNSTALTPFPSAFNLPLTPLTPSHNALYSPTTYLIPAPHSPSQQTHQYNSSAKNGTVSGSYTARSKLAVAGPTPFSFASVLMADIYVSACPEEEEEA